MFVIKASTPEAMRDEIVKWLKYQSTVHGSAARIASLKGTQTKELAKSQAYEDAAKFLEGCIVQQQGRDNSPVAYRWRSIFNENEWSYSTEKPVDHPQYITEVLFNS